jgi:hypothetical protein
MEVDVVMKKIPVVLAALVALPILAVAARPDWSWRAASVDPKGDHMDLYYGSGDEDLGSWVHVARVGPPRGRVFPVQWVVDPRAVENADRIEAVGHDLDYLLTDIGRPDPWSYAQYRCGATSNLYGRVHWWCVQAQPLTLRAAGQQAEDQVP